MTSPAQYRHRIAELNYEEPNLNGVSQEEARKALEGIQQYQQKAQEIERAISVDIQMLRSQYRARTAAASTGSSAGVPISDKRRRSQAARTIEQERINNELESKITPLEEVKKEVDELLAKMSLARTDLEKTLDNQKSRPTPKISS